RRGKQDTAAHLGLNVQVVRYLEVVHYSFKDLRALPWGRQHASTFHAIENIVFCLALPFVSALHRTYFVRAGAALVGYFLIVLFHLQIGEFSLTAGMLQVVSPEARLTFHAHLAD